MLQMMKAGPGSLRGECGYSHTPSTPGVWGYLAGAGAAEYRNLSVSSTSYIRALGYGAENFQAELWPSRDHSAVGETDMGP